MSGKKKRMRETVIEDVGSGQECENSTRNCDDLIGLLQLIKEKQKSQNAKGAALEKLPKMDKVEQPGQVVVAVSDTVNATDVQCAETPQRRKNKKRNKSKKKAAGELASTPIVIHSDSQTEAQNNKVNTDSTDSVIQLRLNAESTEPVSQRKKKKKSKSNVDHGKASQELNSCQSNDTSNGQVEEDNVIVISDHSSAEPPQATSEIIDLTSEDSTLEDPSSFEPYSKDEISMAQACMDLEMTQGQLRWFLRKLKIRNTAARFVPRTSVMENEYAGLKDNFPMPFSS